MSKRVPTSAAARLRQDYLRIKKDPVPFIIAEPLPSNILEWHYVIRGPPKSVYEGGFYHGKLVFPKDFPFKPPKIIMITPNGRFKTNTRLCLSISDFHPDTWNPAWSVSTILTGLLSFMLEKAPTLGSIETTDYQVTVLCYTCNCVALGKKCFNPDTQYYTHLENQILEVKKQYAIRSLEYNLKDSVFVELFPDIVEEVRERLDARNAAKQQQERIRSSSESGFMSELNDNENNGNFLGSTIANVCVILGVLAFGFTVSYVLKAANGHH